MHVLPPLINRRIRGRAPSRCRLGALTNMLPTMAASPGNEWRFSQHLPRVAVFETPLGQIRPDSARFTATRFKMHVLPPLVNKKSSPERHPQAPYPHRRATPPGRHPSDDPTGSHTRRPHPQAARACRLPRSCHRQAPQCDQAPPPWRGGAPQQSRCARA